MNSKLYIDPFLEQIILIMEMRIHEQKWFRYWSLLLGSAPNFKTGTSRHKMYCQRSHTMYQDQGWNFMSGSPIQGLSVSFLVIPWEVCSLHSRIEQSFLSPRTFHVGLLIKDPPFIGDINNLNHWIFFLGAEGNSSKLIPSHQPPKAKQTKP